MQLPVVSNLSVEVTGEKAVVQWLLTPGDQRLIEGFNVAARPACQPPYTKHCTGVWTSESVPASSRSLELRHPCESSPYQVLVRTFNSTATGPSRDTAYSTVCEPDERPGLVEAVIIGVVLVTWLTTIALCVVRWNSLRFVPPRISRFKHRPKNLESVQVVKTPNQSVIYGNMSRTMTTTMEKRLERVSTYQRLQAEGAIAEVNKTSKKANGHREKKKCNNKRAAGVPSIKEDPVESKTQLLQRQHDAPADKKLQKNASADKKQQRDANADKKQQKDTNADKKQQKDTNADKKQQHDTSADKSLDAEQGTTVVTDNSQNKEEKSYVLPPLRTPVGLTSSTELQIPTIRTSQATEATDVSGHTVRNAETKPDGQTEPNTNSRAGGEKGSGSLKDRHTPLHREEHNSSYDN